MGAEVINRVHQRRNGPRVGDGALVSDTARLSGLEGTDLEAAMAALITAGVIRSGGTVRFTHPILRSAIYGDLSPPSGSACTARRQRS